MKKKLMSIFFCVMLVFSFASSAFADSYEPNDTMDTAANIGSYGTVYAKISSPTDVDWFSWAKRYGTHSVTLTAPSGYTYYAELYSNSIGSSTWSYVGSTSSSGSPSTIYYTGSSLGKLYKLVVYSKGGWSDTQYYKLFLS